MSSSLNFIPLSNRKGIPTPKVVFVPYTGQNYGGYYAYDNRLVIVERDEKRTPATIAHEFRHHEQLYRNQFSCRKGSKTYHHLPYEQMIRNYFRSQAHELDALLFERKIAPDDTNEQWCNEYVFPKELYASKYSTYYR